MEIPRPVRFEDAVDFATTKFQVKHVLWARLMIAHGEDQQRGGALDWAVPCYRWFMQANPNKLGSSLVEEFNEVWNAEPISQDVDWLKQRSEEVWYLQRPETGTIRGVSRLYNSAAFFRQQDYNAYERELSRAVAMMAMRDDYGFDQGVFDYLLGEFRSKYSK